MTGPQRLSTRALRARRLALRMYAAGQVPADPQVDPEAARARLAQYEAELNRRQARVEDASWPTL